MEQWYYFCMENEAYIRLGSFFGIFGVMAVWEMVEDYEAETESAPAMAHGGMALPPGDLAEGQT